MSWLQDDGPRISVELRELDPIASMPDQRAIAETAWPSSHAVLFPAGAYDAMQAAGADVTWEIGSPWKTGMAFVDGQPVGFTTVAVRDDEGVTRGLVEPMHVRPEFQRKHIGSALWKWAEDLCWRNGMRSLDVWVLRDNIGAASFYSSRPMIRRTGKQGQMIILGQIRIALELRVDFID